LPCVPSVGARLAPNDKANLSANSAFAATKGGTQRATLCDNSPLGLVIGSPLWIDTGL
jgi:hypothetical protein